VKGSHGVLEATPPFAAQSQSHTVDTLNSLHQHFIRLSVTP